jgi:class 3 adenylate cyclase
MPDLPSGTVTFLFTDIKGSTALWERDRAAMASAVARQIALLDATIQAHGGVHFKTVAYARQSLGADGYQATASAGRALTLEQALAEAETVLALGRDGGAGAAPKP